MTAGTTPEIADAFRRLGVATVYEGSGVPCALDPAIKPVWAGAGLCGPAFTIRCHPGDNLAIHRALEQVPPGEVLVVQAGGHLAGYWGEILTVAAQVRGVAGLVIDGGLRDVDALQRLRFPAFARGAAVFRTVKFEPGDLAVPLVVAGVIVEPGDLVLGDADGVLSVPRARIPSVLEAARRRADRETHYLERIRNGELTLDVLGLRRAPVP